MALLRYILANRRGNGKFIANGTPRGVNTMEEIRRVHIHQVDIERRKYLSGPDPGPKSVRSTVADLRAARFDR